MFAAIVAGEILWGIAVGWLMLGGIIAGRFG